MLEVFIIKKYCTDFLICAKFRANFSNVFYSSNSETKVFYSSMFLKCHKSLRDISLACKKTLEIR